MSKNSADFKKLQEQWYKKLEASGFDDIELNEHEFKQHRRLSKKSVHIDTWRAKAAYYDMATSFLNDYKFESNLEKIIWEYHSNAISVRDIAGLLRKAKVAKLNRMTVWRIVHRLEEAMKRMYLSGYASE